jgi:hypothetical protein
LCGLGQTLLDHEDEAAARAFDEARALDPRHRYWTTSLAEFNLADIRVRQGDRRALAAIAACLRLLQRTGNRGQLIGEIASAAGVLAILGEDEAAAVLSGVQLTGFNATPRDAARIDLARQRLGEGKFLAHAAVGTDWGEDEAVERVCRLLDSLAASATTDQPPEEGESDAAVDDAGHQ